MVSIFLLVVDEDHLAFALTEVVSNRYLMDFLAKGDTTCTPSIYNKSIPHDIIG